MWWDPDPVSGLGGWGDPNDDHQITTGAFASGFPVSYPVPHRIRRQYTPIVPNVPEPLADLFTFETQKALVNGHVGDFIGFQAGYESRSHAAVHQIVGGCVITSLICCSGFVRSQNSRRDLLGNCPSNAVDCVVGAKWPPNGVFSASFHNPIPAVLTFFGRPLVFLASRGRARRYSNG